MGTIAVLEKDKMLDAVTGGASYTAPTDCYAKLHIGDPGSAGTSNAAAETTRKIVAFGTPSSSASIASTAAVQWTSLPAAETISWVSFWSASTAGTFLGKDDLPTARTVAIGDTLTINSGDITFSIAD